MISISICIPADDHIFGVFPFIAADDKISLNPKPSHMFWLGNLCSI